MGRANGQVEAESGAIPGAGSAIFSAGMLRGQSALVTGGGTGLGKATALELARCGASVTIAGRREDVLAEAAAEIGGILGGDWVVEAGETVAASAGVGAGRPANVVRTVCGDIREPADAQRMIGAVLERDRRLDLLVNNAGGQFFSPAELIASKGWRAVWRLNVQGMLNMAEAAYELAFAGEGPGAGGGAGAGGSRGGRIVNVTLSPHHGMPGMAHSGAARATVEALTRELAERWAGAGVTVSTIAVGTFDTEVMVKYPAAVRAGMSRSVPVQRLGTPGEHAWLVALLASPLGGAFSGATVTLDGARDNWFGPWPPPGLVDEAGEVPVEERRGAEERR
ncbi:MAG: SDR family NAD(P)-dependent oxidoreductase [Solirubrobacterales bacterium]